MNLHQDLEKAKADLARRQLRYADRPEPLSRKSTRRLRQATNKVRRLERCLAAIDHAAEAYTKMLRLRMRECAITPLVLCPSHQPTKHT